MDRGGPIFGRRVQETTEKRNMSAVALDDGGGLFPRLSLLHVELRANGAAAERFTRMLQAFVAEVGTPVPYSDDHMDGVVASSEPHCALT